MSFQGIDPVRFGIGVSGTTLTQGVNDPELGTRAMIDGNEYLFVYNATGSAVTQNQIAVLQSGSSGYSVTRSSVIGVTPVMGVFANTGVSAAAYCWIMTKGFCDVEPVSNVVSGAVAIAGTDGQSADPSVAAATASTGYAFAICQEATAACGAGKCYVSCF
jgi:hypothetical protein